MYCVCSGPWPFNLFFPVVLSLFWLGGSFTALIIWSVKTCVLGPPILSPPVSLQNQVVVSCELLPGHQCIWFRGEPTLFPGWCKFLWKLCYIYSNHWLVTLQSCFQPASLTPHPIPIVDAVIPGYFKLCIVTSSVVLLVVKDAAFDTSVTLPPRISHDDTGSEQREEQFMMCHSESLIWGFHQTQVL